MLQCVWRRKCRIIKECSEWKAGLTRSGFFSCTDFTDSSFINSVNIKTKSGYLDSISLIEGDYLDSFCLIEGDYSDRSYDRIKPSNERDDCYSAK